MLCWQLEWNMKKKATPQPSQKKPQKQDKTLHKLETDQSWKKIREY